MALLPKLASRLNDIEISASAPITETLMRRFGSNVNFILDFLGVTDGSSTATGTLSDLSAAVETANNHNFNVETSFAKPSGTITVPIGSYNQPKFLNQVFYMRINANTLNANNISMPGYSIRWQRDGGGYQIMAPFSVGSTSGIPNPALPDFLAMNNASTNGLVFSRQTPRFVEDFDIPANGSLTFPIFYLDYRDAGTNFDFNINIDAIVGNISTIDILRSYVLNIGSSI